MPTIIKPTLTLEQEYYLERKRSRELPKHSPQAFFEWARNERILWDYCYELAVFHYWHNTYEFQRRSRSFCLTLMEDDLIGTIKGLGMFPKCSTGPRHYASLIRDYWRQELVLNPPRRKP